MNNEQRKEKKTNYNQSALAALELKYGFSKYYIRQSINGARIGITPDSIKKDYKNLCRILQEAEKTVVQDFTNQ